MKLPDKVTLKHITTVILFAVVLNGIMKLIFGLNLIETTINQITLCPIHYLTGLLCPGCGMTRAFLAIGQLKFDMAYQLNPLSIPLFSIATTYVMLKHRPAKIPLTISISTLLLVSTLFLFRNI